MLLYSVCSGVCDKGKCIAGDAVCRCTAHTTWPHWRIGLVFLNYMHCSGSLFEVTKFKAKAADVFFWWPCCFARLVENRPSLITKSNWVT